MKYNIRETWEQLAVNIAEIFESQHIPYHFDGSSSLYLRGHDFEMDDLDVTVMWGRIDDSHNALANDSRVKILDRSNQSIEARVGGKIVHVMTYESDTGIGEDTDREQILIKSHSVWCKTVDFYFRGIKPSHPMYELAKQAASSRPPN